jgi:UDP-N-acetylglucosamine 2-epimerase (non-hydrolysing)/GDP/UDP-N,N'-diacetylbacillosamine 2-epimerase (hydrolysing)
LGTLGFADALDRLKPDIMLVLGDRFEILAAVTAATMLRIPVAHLHGGESTEGAIDEAIRHAVTKMAHLHFTAAEAYRRRVVQMGESPERVFFVGAPGLENLTRLPLFSKSELEKELDVSLDSPLLLVTYHPVTLEGSPEKPFNELLQALDAFPNARVVFTMPNADTEGRRLIEMIQNFVAARQERAKAFVSLGQKRYLSLMKVCDAVVGNSSSGLTEAPACGKPTVNLGNRQKGRLKADSVIDCAEKREDIIDSISLVLTPAFVERARRAVSLYGSGDVAQKIVDVLRTYDLNGILEKKFHMLEEDR